MAESLQSSELEDLRIDNDPSESEVTGNETATEKETLETPKNEPKKLIKEESSSQRQSIGNKRPVSSTSSVMKTTASTTARGVGGTNKQPIKTHQASTVRKSTSTIASQTSGHVRSQNSIGGSGDEKRKMLASTARRASLTPTVSTHPPTRSETLAEKRGVTTSAGRRPTTSADSAGIKSSAKSNTIPTKPASSTRAKSTTTPKLSSPGAISEAKKKLPTTTGSSSVNKPPVRNSTSSIKEIDDLKAKLFERDAQIEGLKCEVAAVEKKLQEFNEDVSEKSRKVTEAEEEIATKNNQIIEKINSEHQAELERLNSDLEKAQTDKESLEKLIEEAQAVKALEISLAIDSLKKEHDLTVSALKSELAKSQEICASLTSTLSEKSTEIENLKSEISQAEASLQDLENKHNQNIDCLERSLAEKHTAALSLLNKQFEDKLHEKDSNHEKIIADLKNNNDTTIHEIQTDLNETVTSHIRQNQILEDKIKDLNLEISRIQENATKTKAEAESQLTVFKEEIKTLKENSESIQKQTQEKESKAAEEIMNLSTDLAISSDLTNQIRLELDITKQMMKSFEDHEKSKDDRHNKTQADLELVTKMLKEKKEEITELQEKYQNELRITNSNFEEQKSTLLNESAAIRGNFEDLKAKHEELSRKYDEACANHTKELDIAREEFNFSKNINSKYEKEIEDLKSIHKKKIEEAHNKAIYTKNKDHISELKTLQDKHEKVVSELQRKCATNESEALAYAQKLQNMERDLRGQLVDSQKVLDKIKCELDNARKDLAHEKIEKAVAKSELDIALNKKPDTTEVDNLKKKLQTLHDQRQKEIELSANDLRETKTAQEKLMKEKEERLSKNIEKNKTLAEFLERTENEKSNLERRLKEAEALLKVKDAEICEATARLASLTQSHVKAGVNSVGDHAGVVDALEESGSSAALASTDNFDEKLAQAKVSAQHIVQMNEELQNNNLRSLQSITDV